MRVVVRLWKKMVMRLGHRWSSAFGDALNDERELTDTADEWRRDLGDLTVDQVALGIDRSRVMPGSWWPTLQGFRELCMPRPEDIGLPTVERAYQQAVNKDWHHPVVWHAVQEIGAYEFHHQAEAKSRPLFNKVYGALVARAIAGEVFEVPVVEGPRIAYEAPVVVESHGDPKSHIAAMKELLGKGGEA